MGKFLEDTAGLIPELFKKEETLLILFILGLAALASFSVFQFTLGPTDISTLLFRFLAATWWFWLFFPLIWIFQSALLFWRQEEYKVEQEFVILEIKIPREIQRGPKAMEQILLILHSLRNVPHIAKAKYYEGEITTTFSFEMVSIGGEVHFYVRTIKKHRGVVEAGFFSYYPDVELVEVPDYTERFPQSAEEMYRSGMKVWGTEMVLAREDMYPLKTYAQFETGAEEKQFDPISSFLEVLGKAGRHEIFGIQILATPADHDWGEDWKEKLEKLRKEAGGVVPAAFGVVPAASGEGAATAASGATWIPQPAKQEALKAVENNLIKSAFETTIRLIYLAPEDNFSESFLKSGIVSAFSQYSAINLNALEKNSDVETKAGIWYSPYIFPETRVEYRRQRMLFNYLRRETPQEFWVGKLLTSHLYNWNFASREFNLSVEGLATIFHLPPAMVLTAPHIQRMESRKGGPSAGLAIFGEESEIERFY